MAKRGSLGGTRHYPLTTDAHEACIERCKAAGILVDEDCLRTVLSVFQARHGDTLMPESMEAHAVTLADDYYAACSVRAAAAMTSKAQWERRVMIERVRKFTPIEMFSSAIEHDTN